MTRVDINPERIDELRVELEKISEDIKNTKSDSYELLDMKIKRSELLIEYRSLSKSYGSIPVICGTIKSLDGVDEFFRTAVKKFRESEPTYITKLSIELTEIWDDDVGGVGYEIEIIDKTDI